MTPYVEGLMKEVEIRHAAEQAVRLHSRRAVEQRRREAREKLEQIEPVGQRVRPRNVLKAFDDAEIGQAARIYRGGCGLRAVARYLRLGQTNAAARVLRFAGVKIRAQRGGRGK